MDIIQNLIARVSGDTSQARGEMHKLSKEAGSVGASFNRMSEGFGKSMDSIMGGLAKFNLALGGAKAILDGVGQALEFAQFSASMRELERNLPTGALGKLRVASQGLVVESDLLRLGVKGLTGDFALTASQMDTVMQAAIALNLKGYGPVTEITEKLLEATAKGPQRLDDFGIELEKTGDRALDTKRIMLELHDVVGDTAPMDSGTRAIKRQQVAIADFGDAVKKTLGDIVTSVSQGMLDLKGETGFGRFVQTVSGTGTAFGAVRQYKEALDSLEAKRGDSIFTKGLSAYEDFMAQLEVDAEMKLRAERDKRRSSRPVKRTPTHGGGFGAWNDMAGAPMGWAQSGIVAAGSFAQQGGEALEFGNKVDADTAGRVQAGAEADAQHRADLAGQFGIQGAIDWSTPELEKHAEIMGMLGDKATVAGAGYATLESAILSATDAAITGSDGMGKAALKGAAMSLRSIALTEVPKGIAAAAEGFSALAIGKGDSAAGFFTSSVKHFAAAAAAGGASALLGAAAGGGGGGGGGSPSSPAGGGFSSGSGAGAGRTGGDTFNINIGAGFVGQAKELGEEITRQISAAQRSGRVRSGSDVVTMT